MKSAVAENHPSRNVLGVINLIASTGFNQSYKRALSALREHTIYQGQS